ncbi:hypothetical protein [Winogradskyella sp.]|uniref:hypothetical protein n=1 Tax=Winogradskyella sp. TaxID=1883156 RepID=UPI0025EB8FAF|nr:hypothetical protein [Winogradskyella sp.]MBT8244549.1 hypothetical protein [Winogradskyella sp.]
MKNLELNQMEEVQGGACTVGIALAFVGVTILAASNPAGWLALASFATISGGMANACISEYNS